LDLYVGNYIENIVINHIRWASIRELLDVGVLGVGKKKDNGLV
jgi:hypothetical protein